MRIARLINIIMLLLRIDKISANELAARFEVSRRTIYRDVETLNLAGIPIYTTRGRGGGIGLMATYKVDKKLLTASDISNLMVALTSVHTLINSPELQATLQKITAMYAADHPDNHLMIDRPNWPGSVELKQLAERLDAAISDQQLVTFAYSDRNGHNSQRQIEPYRLVFKGERWYVQGYSLERQAFRFFRLARMQQVTITTTTFVPRVVPPLNFDYGVHPTERATITLKADNFVRDQIIERFGFQVIQSSTPHAFIATIQLPDTERAYQFILSLGTRVRLVGDSVFKQHLKHYLNQMPLLND